MCRNFLDRMGTKEQADLELTFAECIYAGGLSHNSMTSKRWIKFFKMIRPNFTVPTRDRLSNDLLDKSYKRTEKIANIYLERADCVSLIIDGWTNVRKDAIINIVALTPQSVFIKSIDTKGAVKNADYMFKILDEIIFNIGPKKVAGLIADN